MEANKIKEDILYHLLEIRKENGQAKRISLSVIASKLNISHDIIMLHASELAELGHIKIPGIPDFAHITEKGMIMVDKNNPYLAKQEPAVKSVHIGSVTDSAIAFDNGTATKVNVNDFLKKIEHEISNSNLTKEEQKTWLSRINEMSKHPVISGIIKAALISVV